MSKRSRSGYTMVELIVTFALLTLFAAGAAAVICRVGSSYSSAVSRASAMNVSEILLDKISGEIAGAQGGVKPEYTLIISDGTGEGCLSADDYSSLETPHSCAAFCTRTGSPVYILADDDGYLLIHYRPVTDNNLNLKSKDWRYDELLYRNYVITALTFEIIESGKAKTNVIKISLTLENKSNGFVYACERFTECYNFSSVDIVKISYGAIAKDSEVN